MAVVQMEYLEKGQRIAEYEVLKLIARGPCGATYQVAQRKTGKEFALKSYHPMAFKDGKIVGGGDYFDFGGFMASFQE